MNYRSAEEIINDTQKGAAELMKDAAETILELDVSKGKEFMIKIVKKRYSMTPLINLANVFFLSIENDENSTKAVENYMKDIEKSKNNTIRKMKSIIEKKGYDHVSTLSYSSTVISSLEDVREMTVFESRPLNEGRKTAKILNSKGVDVNYWIDAGMMKGIKGCDAVISGADTISDEGFLNKLGSYPLVLAAKERDIPVHVVCDHSKILPNDLKMSEGESHISTEVWGYKNGMKVYNEYFECVPMKYVSFVTGKNQFEGEEIKTLIERKKVSGLLKNSYPLR